MLDKREYDKKYRLAHQEEIKEYKKEYRLAHPEGARARNKKYQSAHPEGTRARSKKYRLRHLERVKARHKKYYATHRKKERARNKKWHLAHPERVKEMRRKVKAMRKDFGFIPLNEYFTGSVGHHIDFNYVIYIPEKIHQKYPHSVLRNQNMDKINSIALEFLKKEGVKNGKGRWIG